LNTPGELARTAGRKWLRDALQRTRARTLALFAAYEKSLSPALSVPYSPDVNPPVWELGHIGWFQEWWIARNPQRALGVACVPGYEPLPSRMSHADALYDSSNVPHHTRWSLPLPNADATRAYLQDGLVETLARLGAAAEDDASLYFFRLVLLHEDMHNEAAVYMAQALGIPLDEFVAFPGTHVQSNSSQTLALKVRGQYWMRGNADTQPGFAFDNEHATHAVALADYEIDAAPVSWARYLECIEAGGIDQPPRYLRKTGPRWERQSFGKWMPLALEAPAVHLTLQEARAWCAWAGRRLPTEAEWEFAASNEPAFRWGQVWEWTADAFEPYPGFAPHPYRDYSAPWFSSRQALRGASEATSAHIAHSQYRNFFTPERNDIYSGFRSCAL
jgi:iron(II)-dependent oxidoreductase